MTMIEKVARAMCEAEHKTFKGTIWFDSVLNEEGREDYRVLARAAIEALMEPDERMISAYFEKCAELGFTAHITATAAWQAMLSAALERENV